jgi:DNA-binding transcriptional ArsR family regulator
MSDVFRALADPTRRKVLELLRQQPMTAGELSERFPVSRSTMSAHFSVLREAGLIDSVKIGTTITYQLRLSVLEDALLGFARLFSTGAEQPAPASAATKAISHRGRKGAAG